MTQEIVYLVIGIIGVIAIIIVVSVFGNRIKSLDVGKGMIKIEQEPEPNFRIDIGPVNTTNPNAPIVPVTNNSANDPNLSPFFVAGLNVPQGDVEPEFMSEDYIVMTATELQLRAEDGDIVRFLDRTSQRRKD